MGLSVAAGGGGIKIVALWIMRQYNLLCVYTAEEFIDSTSS
jgi:hypothetical protein